MRSLPNNVGKGFAIRPSRCSSLFVHLLVHERLEDFDKTDREYSLDPASCLIFMNYLSNLDETHLSY